MKRPIVFILISFNAAYHSWANPMNPNVTEKGKPAKTASPPGNATAAGTHSATHTNSGGNSPQHVSVQDLAMSRPSSRQTVMHRKWTERLLSHPGMKKLDLISNPKDYETAFRVHRKPLDRSGNTRLSNTLKAYMHGTKKSEEFINRVTTSYRMFNKQKQIAARQAVPTAIRTVISKEWEARQKAKGVNLAAKRAAQLADRKEKDAHFADFARTSGINLTEGPKAFEEASRSYFDIHGGYKSSIGVLRRHIKSAGEGPPFYKEAINHRKEFLLSPESRKPQRRAAKQTAASSFSNSSDRPSSPGRSSTHESRSTHDSADYSASSNIEASSSRHTQSANASHQTTPSTVPPAPPSPLAHNGKEFEQTPWWQDTYN